MGAFAGWEMPMRYTGIGDLQTVLTTRTACSIFDISHMTQFEVTHGGNEHATLSDVMGGLLHKNLERIPIGKGRLALLLNREGGILDDVIISKPHGAHVTLVGNALRKDVIRAHLQRSGLVVRDLGRENCFFSLQGPEAETVLYRVLGRYGLDTDLPWMLFMDCIQAGHFLISRSGYTGEDGFEVSLSQEMALPFIGAALQEGACLAGLIARDILRIEAGLLLNGQDMDEGTRPEQVGLAWAFDKEFRARGIANLLFGIASSGGPIPRRGTEIFDLDQKAVGQVTSACFSPTLQRNIALARGRPVGADVLVGVRGRLWDYRMTGLPFVEHRYKKY